MKKAVLQRRSLPHGWGWLYKNNRAKKDIIVRGGENISSREVEDIYCSILKFTMPVWLRCPMNVWWTLMRLCRAESTASFIIAGEVVAFFSRKRVAKYKYPEHMW